MDELYIASEWFPGSEEIAGGIGPGCHDDEGSSCATLLGCEPAFNDFDDTVELDALLASGDNGAVGAFLQSRGELAEFVPSRSLIVLRSRSCEARPIYAVRALTADQADGLIVALAVQQ